MTHPSVRTSFLLTGLVAALLLAPAGAPALAAPPDPAGPTGSLTPAPTGPVVDGFRVEHRPADVGELVSTFEWEWEDVAFASRVWERGPDAEGAYEVDLTVKVLRGPGLTDLAALTDFLAEYHEQDPTAWSPVSIGDRSAVRRPGAVFWSVAPGVAIEVDLNEQRFGPDELLAVAAAVRPVRATGPAGRWDLLPGLGQTARWCASGSGEEACAQ